jgi:outer membrane receptor for ferrienterochelin and colicin
MKKYFKLSIFVYWLLFLCLPMVYSQTTGKIAGLVLEEKSGEPLPGANISIVGTTMGTAADEQGEFFIINIPPGTYDIEAEMIGYTAVRVENIRVFVNRTVPIEFRLKETVLEGEVITVKADKIVMKRDQTSSIRNISSEDIEVLPVENVNQVIAIQPGVVAGHFRGGRSNEVTYLLDGVAVTDAFSNEYSISQVNPEVVEDIEVITGTFNAEYGNAMSGVVNVITKEGGNRFNGSGSVNFGNYVTSHNDIFPGLRTFEFNRNQDYKMAISGPILSDNLFFVANARFNKNLGHLTGTRMFNVDDYSDFTSQYEEEWHVESTGDDATVPMNWNEDYSAFGKLILKSIQDMKVFVSVTWNKGKGQGYDHASKFNPDGRPTWHNESLLGMMHFNHMISTAAFYELKVSYSDYWTGYYIFESPKDPGYVHDEYSRNNGSWFYTGGQSKEHSNHTEKKYNTKLDFTWQLNKRHSIKTGLDFSQLNIDHAYYTIRNAYEGTGMESEYFIDEVANERIYPFYEPTIHSNESIHTDVYTVKPVQASYYIQDKMEFSMMVVNFGVRFDYIDPKTVYPSNYRNPANQEYFEQAERMSSYPQADAKSQISPRIGLSYNLGNTALLRFAYGHFLQLPPLNYYYQNSTFRIAAWDYATTMGNAQLNSQKTIQYEVGLFQQIMNEMSLDVAVWYKDIYDLVTATVYTTYNQRRYGVFTNKEYANARGLEIKYDYRTGALTAGINYTLAYAKGVADNPYSSFTRAGGEMDPVNKLIPMVWDQRHTLNLSFGYNKEKYGTTFIWYLNSGQPYTWSPIPQSPLSAINLFPNNQYRPAKNSLDLSAYYSIYKMNTINVRLTLLVYNLLDRLNENWVNSQTGRAYTDVVQETDILGHRSTFSTYEDVYQNPSMYSAPRFIKLGLGVIF